MKQDKERACEEIAKIIKTLCNKHGVAPFSLKLGNQIDHSQGGTQWDGTVKLTIGC